jgi:hypothetical protein
MTITTKLGRWRPQHPSWRWKICRSWETGGRSLAWSPGRTSRPIANDSKLRSAVTLSSQRTDNVLIQLCNRLVCRESHLASLQEAQDHFESLPHDEFFALVLDLYRDADRIQSPESHIETNIKGLPLKLSLTDLSAGFQYQTSVHSLLKREGRDMDVLRPPKL